MANHIAVHSADEDYPGKVKVRSDGTVGGTTIVVLGDDLAEHSISGCVDVRISVGHGASQVTRVTLSLLGVGLDVAGQSTTGDGNAEIARFRARVGAMSREQRAAEVTEATRMRGGSLSGLSRGIGETIAVLIGGQMFNPTIVMERNYGTPEAPDHYVFAIGDQSGAHVVHLAIVP